MGYMTNAKNFSNRYTFLRVFCICIYENYAAVSYGNLIIFSGVPAMEHWISAILLVLHTRVLSNGVEIAAALSLVTFAKDWLKEQSHNTGKCKLLPLA